MHEFHLLETFQHKYKKCPCMRHFDMRLSQNELYKQIDICTSITPLVIFGRGYSNIYIPIYKSVLSTIFLSFPTFADLAIYRQVK